METNLMHYLSLLYFVKQFLHVSGVFIAHHHEVFIVYVQRLVHDVCLGGWLLVSSGWNMYQLLYICSEYLLMMGNK
jgi:hypothetical protein